MIIGFKPYEIVGYLRISEKMSIILFEANHHILILHLHVRDFPAYLVLTNKTQLLFVKIPNTHLISSAYWNEGPFLIDLTYMPYSLSMYGHSGVDQIYLINLKEDNSARRKAKHNESVYESLGPPALLVSSLFFYLFGIFVSCINVFFVKFRWYSFTKCNGSDFLLQPCFHWILDVSWLHYLLKLCRFVNLLSVKFVNAYGSSCQQHKNLISIHAVVEVFYVFRRRWRIDNWHNLWLFLVSCLYLHWIILILNHY